MTHAITKIVKAVLLSCFIVGATQTASYAGFADLFKDDAEAESFKATAPQNRRADVNETSIDEEDGKLSPKKIHSAVHELFHDEFADEDVDKKLANARKTIEKGEKMMQACGEDHNKAEYKKGKVMKEIGEKQIADLKSKSGFQINPNLDPEHPSKREKLDSL